MLGWGVPVIPARQTDTPPPPRIKLTLSSELLMEVVSSPSLGGMQVKSLWFDMWQAGDELPLGKPSSALCVRFRTGSLHYL